MEIHSCQGSLDPLWNSTARMGASEEPVSVALPAVPSCDIKPVFLLAMLNQHGRKAAWGCGKPQPWRPWTAMEIHSYQGSLDPLWNSTAMVGVHSYGIPEQVQTDSGVECTHRFPACRRIQSCPGTCALFAQFLCDRSFPSPALACAWQSFSARLTIFSLGTKNAVRTGRRKSWRRMKNSIVRNWQDLLRVYVFSPDWTNCPVMRKGVIGNCTGFL
jgi:hypothetical protein